MSLSKRKVIVDPTWRDSGFLDGPRGICCSNNVIFICDLNQHRVRGTSAFNLDEVWDEIGCENKDAPMTGLATEVHFVKPRYIWPGLHGEFYLTSTDTCLIYEYNNGRVTVKAGTGRGWRDGPAMEASFLNPRGGCVDPATGDIYIADFGNDRVRVIGADGMVRSIGKGKRLLADGNYNEGGFADLSATYHDNGFIYVVQDGAVRVIDIAMKEISTFAGSSETGYLDGPCKEARFSHLYDIKRGGTRFFVADHGNSRIRVIDENLMVSTLFHPDDQHFFSDSPPFALAFLPQGHLMFTCSSRGKVRVFPNLLPSNVTISLQEWANLVDSSSDSSDSSTTSNSNSIFSENPIDIGGGIRVHKALIDLAYPYLATSSIPPHFPDQHLSAEDIRSFLYSHKVPSSCDSFGAIGLIAIVKACKLGSALKHASFVYLGDQLRSSPPSFPSLFEYISKACSNDLEVSKLVLSFLIRQKEAEQLFQDVNARLDSPHFVDSLKSLSLDLQTRNSTIKQYAWKKGLIQSRLEALYWKHVFPSFPPDIAISDGTKAQREALPTGLLGDQWPDSLIPQFRLVSSDGHAVLCHDWLLYSRWPFFRLMVASGGIEVSERALEMPKDPGFSVMALKAFLYYLYTSQVTECDTNIEICLEILRNAQFLRLMKNEWPSAAEPGFEFLVSHCQSALIRHPSIKTDCLNLLQLALEVGAPSHCKTLREVVISELGTDALSGLLEASLLARLESIKI